MELIISRLSHHYQGLKIAINDQDYLRTISIVNGNDAEFLGTIILLNVDQHAVYGLSHPEIVSRILEKGPQSLLTTKDTAHNLFEHGMKASLGKLKLNMNQFLTTLETFYTPTTKAANLTLVVSRDNQLGCLIQPRTDMKPILISNSTFLPKESDKDILSEVSNSIELDNIRTFVTSEFKVNYGHTTPK